MSLCLLSTIALGACGKSDPVGNASDPSTTPTSTGSDDAQIRLVYADDPGQFAEIETFLKEREVFDDIVGALNAELRLDKDIVVNVGGDPQGPYFDPSTGAIEYPYEFMSLVSSVFEDDYEGEELQATASGALRFVLIHELGHALIEHLEVPVLGREEDAVDGLATVVLTQVLPARGVDPEAGAYDALSAAELFFDFSGEGGGGDGAAVNVELETFADEHSLDLQRFYSIACLVAGSSETNYETIAQAGFVPESRLERCPGEYEQASKSWAKLLEPHFEK